MDWRELFLSFDGRISRQPFWIGSISILLVSLVLTSVLPLFLEAIVGLVLIYPGLAVSVKRCHDRGKSGWWCLLFLIPFVGAIWAIIDLGLLEGAEGDNRYGPNPLSPVTT